MHHCALEAINKDSADVFKRVKAAWLMADDWGPDTKGKRSLHWRLEDTLLLFSNLRRPAVAHAAEKKLWLHVETICFSEYRSLGSSVFEAAKAMGKWKMKSCGFASLLRLQLHASPFDKTEYEK